MALILPSLSFSRSIHWSLQFFLLKNLGKFDFVSLNLLSILVFISSLWDSKPAPGIGEDDPTVLGILQNKIINIYIIAAETDPYRILPDNCWERDQQ